MNRQGRIEVFNSTIRKIQEDSFLKSSLKNSIMMQKVIKNIAPLDSLEELTLNKSGIIRLSKDRSFQAAMRNQKLHNATLNFASWINPGGGVENGSSAQEESLCRISTLFPALNDEKMMNEFYYPHRASKLRGIYNDDIIYTPNITIFRQDDEYMDILPSSKWGQSDVITIAAPNLNYINDYSQVDLDNIYRNRISKALSAAYQNNADCVILGAFGCGVFGNDPYRVAKATLSVLSKVRKCFEVIELPIFCAYDSTNYDAFMSVFAPVINY